MNATPTPTEPAYIQTQAKHAADHDREAQAAQVDIDTLAGQAADAEQQLRKLDQHRADLVRQLRDVDQQRADHATLIDQIRASRETADGKLVANQAEAKGYRTLIALWRQANQAQPPAAFAAGEPVRCPHCQQPMHRPDAEPGTKWQHTGTAQYQCRPGDPTSPFAEHPDEMAVTGAFATVRPEVPAHG
jgi:hypothetical protein